MRAVILLPASAGLLALLACGDASGPGMGEGEDASAISEYRELAQRVQSAALSYGATMGGAEMTVEGCVAAHDAYDAQVRPWMSQMVEMGGAMDGFISAHGGAPVADVNCLATAMMDDLDAHRLVACTFANLGDDRAEAFRHVDVMGAFGARVDERCGEMMSGLGGGEYGWGPADAACEGTWDGSGGDPGMPHPGR